MQVAPETLTNARGPGRRRGLGPCASRAAPGRFSVRPAQTQPGGSISYAGNSGCLDAGSYSTNSWIRRPSGDAVHSR